jgi:radical SAM-linked protein
MVDPSLVTDSAAPNPQQVVVQKLRVRYAKRGRLRFTSHRDFARAFERAVRRAEIPIGYSSGFTPHPKISYANASPTGAGSEAEFLEIGLTRPCEADLVRVKLDEALPPGLDIVDVVVAGPGSLNDRLQASSWSITFPETAAEAVQDAVTKFLAADEVPVERMTKRGLKTFDARGAVVGMSVRAGGCEEGVPQGECAILDVVIRHDVAPGGAVSIRPDDVLAGLRARGGLTTNVTPVAVRSAQGPLNSQDGTVGDPLALDRDAL